MNYCLEADDDLFNALVQSAPQIHWHRLMPTEEKLPGADAYFFLKNGRRVPGDLSAPVFVNSVAETLEEAGYAENVIRLNGWPPVIGSSVWEGAGTPTSAGNAAITSIGKSIRWVPDLPGFVTARIIAMIINEAFFALEEKVSSEADINIALKLGTNYPYGPFEWARLIGEKNVLELLEKLAAGDARYSPAKALREAANL